MTRIKHRFDQKRIMKFFVWLDDQQQGPFEEEVIRKMLSEKQIGQDTLVCPEGGNLDWASVKELFFLESLPESFLQSFSLEEISNNQFYDGSKLVIQLNSGLELKVKAIRLFDEIELAEVNAKKAKAMEMFKGVSTGIGAWGSIEWVLAASVAIGAVESVLSAGAASSGADLLREAIQAERQLRKEGVFFPVSKIQYIDTPIPGGWRAFAKKSKVVTAFVHIGDDFISVKTDDDSICSVRWSAVESNYYSKPAI